MSRLVDCARVVARLVPIYATARAQAEALVWHHGAAGVEAARERLRLSEDGVDYALAWLVLRLAESRVEMLDGLDTGTRYEVLSAWRARPGQLIG